MIHMHTFFFCYAFCNLTNGLNISKYQNILKLTSLLTETLRIYDLQLLTLMAHVGEEQFFIKQRICTLKLLPSYQMGTGKQIIVSDPYVSWIDVVFISQTTNLTHKQFEGLIGQDLDFTRMPKIQTNTSQYYLVDSSGNIVISDLYANGVKVLIKMYDQSLTGFNETDWNNLIKEGKDIFTCTIAFIRKYHSLENNTDQIKLFLFVVYDESQYLKQQQDIYNKQIGFQNQLIDSWLQILGTFLYSLQQFRQ